MYQSIMLQFQYTFAILLLVSLHVFIEQWQWLFQHKMSNNRLFLGAFKMLAR